MTPISWIDGSGSVTAAAQQLVAVGAVLLPVCGPRRLFLGVLSERDIVKRCVAESLDPVLVHAGELIDPADPQYVIRHDQPAGDRVLLVMFREGLDWLPVVNDDDRLIGRLSLVDVAACPR